MNLKVPVHHSVWPCFGEVHIVVVVFNWFALNHVQPQPPYCDPGKYYSKIQFNILSSLQSGLSTSNQGYCISVYPYRRSFFDDRDLCRTHQIPLTIQLLLSIGVQVQWVENQSTTTTTKPPMATTRSWGGTVRVLRAEQDRGKTSSESRPTMAINRGEGKLEVVGNRWVHPTAQTLQLLCFAISKPSDWPYCPVGAIS